MNKTTKHYFINLFKRKKKILAIYTFICFMAFPFLEIASIFSNGTKEDLHNVVQLSFVLALLTLGILSAVLPIFTFRFSLTKKHVDTYFAIPLNRNHLFKSHFISPILGACIPILINYVIGGLIFSVYTGNYTAFVELFILLLLAFVMFACVYSFNTFFVLNSNNVLDASIITASIAVLPIVFSSAVTWFVDSQIVSTGMIETYQLSETLMRLLSPYAGFVELGTGIDQLVHLYVDFSSISFNYLFYYLVIGIVFYILSKKMFKKKKGENAEQLSTSPVTYPLLINVGLISLILIFNLMEAEIIGGILVIVMIFVAYVIASSIANRRVQLNTKMIVKFILLIVAVNGFNFVSRQTEFFGINRKVIDYTQYDEIDFTYYSYSSKFDENEEDREIRVFINVKNMNEKEKELMELLVDLQKERSLIFAQSGNVWIEDSIGTLNVGYNKYLSEYTTNYRNAYFNLTDAEENQFYQLVGEITGEE